MEHGENSLCSFLYPEFALLLAEAGRDEDAELLCRSQGELRLFLVSDLGPAAIRALGVT